MRILHLAPFNTAGVPFNFVKAERCLGHDSRLVTLAKDPQGREEDICLHLPFIDFWGTRLVKNIVTPERRRKVSHVTRIPDQVPIEWNPSGLAERLLFGIRENIWKPKINRFLQQIDLFKFDLIQLDGGLGFYRDARLLRQLKDSGIKLICCYTGSDLRVRGVIPAIDDLADLNVSVEFDHLRFHTHIHHVPFPLDTSHLNPGHKKTEKLSIGHAPTNRMAKGSQIIIPIVRQLEKEFPIQFILIENETYDRAIELKRSCHIFIDQIGDLGYGINGIEALALGIPTCSSLAPGFEKNYPDHPFITVVEQSLRSELIELIEDDAKRERIGIRGNRWVREIHDPVRSVQRIHDLAGID